MPIVLASLATSFLLTFFFLPLVIRISKRKGFFDQPGGRKIHKQETPSMGGIAIFLGFFISIIIWMSLVGITKYNFFFSGVLIVFIAGLRDDLIPLKPVYKLLSQIVAACMVVFLTDIQLNSLYGLFGLSELPEFVIIAVSVFTIIVITNSFNLIDGLDGLAGSVALISFTFFGIWFYLNGDRYLSVILFTMIGAIIAFLNFNWEPSKIFMGDTGALLIGFILACISIKFIDTNYNLVPENALKFEASIATAVAAIIIPLFDTLRIFISRAIRKQSPFSADKTHIHHLLMRLGLTHAQTAGVIAMVHVSFIILVLVTRDLSENVVLALVIGLGFFYSLLLDFLISRKFPKKRVG